ncbi:glucose 1-dehydrogenase [[Mycobacterium] kokjensenii]|uniref:Glucose 1-dehydrogenase n=1 Tax=[Mycobacterium] kokjensenii TaxID=3064287 RepID=A0ABM9LN49_9MYCO|nr:glucose 1-dehydrogenase [Mycolicibacter sp. MU0083]CAJ1501765.1 glucose 1-dehydrogenase [Mycolicibacter sp. MU0083]
MDKAALNALFDLTGRTAIVTGGTRGIGLSVAHGLAAAGANVVVASRKADACERAAEQLRQAGAQAIGVPTHLGDVEGIRRLVDATVERFGGVDIVVNNAANALALPLDEITSEALDKSFGVNLQGPVFLVQAALPHLRKSAHAAVVNVSSAGAFSFSPATAMYSAAKAALVSFTRSMAAELAPAGIRVNAIAPGPVDTDMVRNNPPEFIAELQSATLLQRLAEPDEMVGPVLLLVSDAGSYITGQTIHPDGGMVAR